MAKPLFGISFLDEHAGSLISNPQMAIVELIANALDAGADKIDIIWPDSEHGSLSITDNGEGMTPEEFDYRWMHFNYNRLQEQGNQIVFPYGNKMSKRKPFGKNGKGRHSMFCFTPNYIVETWKNGIAANFSVERVFDDKTTPYRTIKNSVFPKEGHGTKISGTIEEHYIPVNSIRELLWSKFIADPAVEIYVNDDKVELTDFSENTTVETVETVWGDIPIIFIEGDTAGRTSLQNGIAWWVNGRCVGDLSWKRMSERGIFIDRRTSEGKKFTFIVQADILEDGVLFDWTGFYSNTEKIRTSLSAVEDHIEKWLSRLTYHSRKDQKIAVLKENRGKLEKLPEASKDYIGSFINEIQEKVPTISEDTLSNAVTVICTLEETRSGRELLQSLATFDPQQMDVLNEIIKKWNIFDAKIVLDELQWRLNLIKELERLVDDPSTDELHQLQPLFERGLWIFGPEYETTEFTSNLALTTVVQKFLSPQKKGMISKDMARKRADFVVLPGRSIGVYSRDGFDNETNEVTGIEKILIVELKRGGFSVSQQEVRQAEDYASAIRESGKLMHNGKIDGYVLGSTISPRTGITRRGDYNETIIHPITYTALLRRAHARTFRLLDKIKELHEDFPHDNEIAQVMKEPSQIPIPDFEGA